MTAVLDNTPGPDRTRRRPRRKLGNVPPAAMLAAFRMIRLLGDAVTYVTLFDRLHDREATQAIWALTAWARGQSRFPVPRSSK